MATRTMPDRHDEDTLAHEAFYHKFVKLTRFAAIGFPFFFAFVLYWTQ